MKRIALALSLAAVFAASTRWTLAQQPPQPPLFTGTSAPMDGKDLTAARRSFEEELASGGPEEARRTPPPRA